MPPSFIWISLSSLPLTALVLAGPDIGAHQSMRLHVADGREYAMNIACRPGAPHRISVRKRKSEQCREDRAGRPRRLRRIARSRAREAAVLFDQLQHHRGEPALT